MIQGYEGVNLQTDLKYLNLRRRCFFKRFVINFSRRTN